jgi:CHAT domain-containing protein
MDLVAAGAETLVLSRWNVGGRVSINLGLEFLRDQPIDTSMGSPPSAAERWQRAVDLVTNEQPDFDREPRLQVKGSAVLPDAQHPFFWSGFALIDCGVIPHDAADPPAEAAD